MVCSLVTSQCTDSTVTIVTLDRMGKILTGIAKYLPDSQTSLHASRHCLLLCSPLFHGAVTYWEQDICSWTTQQIFLRPAKLSSLTPPNVVIMTFMILGQGSKGERCVGVEVSPTSKLHSSVPGCAAEIQVVLTCQQGVWRRFERILPECLS